MNRTKINTFPANIYKEICSRIYMRRNRREHTHARTHTCILVSWLNINDKHFPSPQTHQEKSAHTHKQRGKEWREREKGAKIEEGGINLMSYWWASTQRHLKGGSIAVPSQSHAHAITRLEFPTEYAREMWTQNTLFSIHTYTHSVQELN